MMYILFDSNRYKYNTLSLLKELAQFIEIKGKAAQLLASLGSSTCQRSLCNCPFLFLHRQRRAALQYV